MPTVPKSKKALAEFRKNRVANLRRKKALVGKMTREEEKALAEIGRTDPTDAQLLNFRKKMNKAKKKK